MVRHNCIIYSGMYRCRSGSSQSAPALTMGYIRAVRLGSRKIIYLLAGILLVALLVFYYVQSVYSGNVSPGRRAFANKTSLKLGQTTPFPQSPRPRGAAIASSMTSIPRIIHQTWDTTAVPPLFVPWIRSWKRHNPHWQYWFWTPDDVRCLLRQRYPSFVHFYDGYPAPLLRADAMRYFVLHAFGGFYADLDVECLRPLDPLLVNRSCVLSEEPYEHVYVLYHGQGRPNVMNTIMACRPGHGLFEDLTMELPRKAVGANLGSVLTSTGPYFLDSVLRRYISKTKHRPIADQVTVLTPQYLLPTFDPARRDHLKSLCSSVKRPTDSNSQHSMPTTASVCENLRRRNYTNARTTQAYTDHYWVHVHLKGVAWKSANVVDIQDIILDSRRQSESAQLKLSTTFTHDQCQAPRIKVELSNSASSKTP